jgi:homopolymeric O-antigen transport system permease protein
MLRDLWQYRGFVLGMVRREFHVRYLDSGLGSAWALLHPLALIILLTLVLGGLMNERLGGGDRLAYSLRLCVGLFAWNAFAEIVSRCQSVFIEYGELLKKVRFPRLALPLVVLGSATLNLAIGFALLLAFLAVSGRWPGWTLLGATPVLVMLLALALGIGIAVGVLNVFARDVGQVATLALQFLFWLTPIVYPLQILNDWQRAVLHLNPLTHIVVAAEAAVLGGRWPSAVELAVPTAAAAAALLLAVFLFRRLADQMADYL